MTPNQLIKKFEDNGDHEKAEGARELYKIIMGRITATRRTDEGREAYNKYQREYHRKMRDKKKGEQDKHIDISN